MRPTSNHRIGPQLRPLNLQGFAFPPLPVMDLPTIPPCEYFDGKIEAGCFVDFTAVELELVQLAWTKRQGQYS